MMALILYCLIWYYALHIATDVKYEVQLHCSDVEGTLSIYETYVMLLMEYVFAVDLGTFLYC